MPVNSSEDGHVDLLIDRFERQPRPIDKVLDDEGIADDRRAEVERILRTVVLLNGTARALRKAATESITARKPSGGEPTLEPGETVDLKSTVRRLSVVGDCRFVVRDPATQDLIYVNEIEIERAGEPSEAHDEPYRVAAF